MVYNILKWIWIHENESTEGWWISRSSYGIIVVI